MFFKWTFNPIMLGYSFTCILKCRCPRSQEEKCYASLDSIFYNLLFSCKKCKNDRLSRKNAMTANNLTFKHNKTQQIEQDTYSRINGSVDI